MATAIYDSLTQHSSLDGTGDTINGSEVDENPNTLAKILDGTTATDMATDAAVDYRFASDHVGIRFIDTDAASAAVIDAAIVEWDPSDGSNLTDNSSGVALSFKLPGDDDTQDVFGRIATMCVSDAAGAEEGEFSFRLVKAGTVTEIATLAPTTGLTLDATLVLTGTYAMPLRIGTLRLWHDATNDCMRIKHGSAPSSETDGNILVEG